MTGGRSIQPTSQFAGDDGSADAELTRLLALHSTGAVPLADVVARLADTRVLVPVLAELAVGEDVAGPEGRTLHVDKEASSGVVALRAPDGRKALPVFTSVAAMSAWRADARPVPVEAARAALSAVNEDWSLLVVDPGGPVTVLVPRPAVWALAQGERWRPALEATEDGLRVEREVAESVTVAAAPVQHVVRAHAEPGRKAEVAVVLALDPGLDRAGLDAVLAQVNARLGASDVISRRVDSLELRIGAAR
ncbi:SseB family protein [Myceligenerans pegani]|uniref:SseB family protein n=1 Tax=Myceligenerans pegani TaxID=2776917 RepID=A0ABR9MYM1_9MICO|nr:SseB family protein [Myceligenerans sp. TRM 65318]MBE1876481.1 SseB family protein [Myceligenerans sp. TRM 65318]MBE3018752.1 SseB family protein [Myceligenerans sp. TRM 65318]